jgi:tetratricopeptide (TPR) repeat protein
MDTFFLGFRDPLFSVIVFFALIFMITFISYLWGRYKRKEDYKHLNRFLQQFHTPPTEDTIKNSIQNNVLSPQLWLLLASAYQKNAEYEKCIEIYNELLQKEKYANQKEIMFLLGKTYFKAGFLERSKQIFLEILKKTPRTPQALHYLLLIYEFMREYKEALGVLEPLDELGEDVSLEKYYLELLIILQDFTLDSEVKNEKIIQLYKEHNQLTHMVFEYLFRVDAAFAWKHLNIENVENISDILWNLERKDLNLDIISKSIYLQELYSAKGYIEDAKKSDSFELDILIKLQNKANATLSFEYGCVTCKGTFPFAFNRCSQCHSIDSMTIEWSLSRDYSRDFSEENNSFQ